MTAPSDPMTALAQGFLKEPHRLFIDGGFVPALSGESFEIVNPATGRVLAHAAAGGAADIDLAVKAARRAFEDPSWAGLAPAARRALMFRLADAIEAAADELGLIESLDNGMPVMMAKMGGAMGAAECLRYNAGWVGKMTGETPTVSAPNHHAYTLKEPVGVVGGIVPWNFPLPMAVSKIAPAIAAGCTVVLKPAELAPLSAIRLARLIAEVGFPPGVINIVTGFGPVAGQALVDHPDVDKISFTGSTAVGKSLLAGAAGNLKRISLELGGKSPVILFPDADLERAIPGAAMGIFGNAGQVCVAGSRLYVHKAVFDKVVDGISQLARNLRVGPGQQPGTQMGPLISQKQLDRVSGYIASGADEGAEVVVGGKRLEGEGYFLEPTVLTQTDRSMKVVREEIFGPVLCAMPIDDDDLDRIARVANDTSYGLSANIWTRNVSVAHKLARKIKSGMVRVNGGVGLDFALPFGGVKQSGWGRENGREGVETFLETKAVSIAL